MREAQALTEASQLVELLGAPPAVDGQVVRGGTQVLPEGDDVDADVAQVDEGPAHLVGSLAHAEDQTRLGDEPGGRRPPEDGQAAGVGRRRPDRALQACDRLQVVVQHVGPRREDHIEGGRLTLAVGDEHLDRGARRAPANGPNHLGEPLGATVGQVVARHGRHHSVSETHARHRLRHVFGLERVERPRAARVDEAEPARARAPVAVDHECGGPVVPTLEDVGAARLLAHGDEVEAPHGPPDASELGSHVRLHPQPRGLARLDRQRRRVDAGVAGRRRHVVALDRAPSLCGPRDDGVDDLAHGHVDSLRRERRHLPVVDATRHDVPEHREVGVDVQREAVHRAAACEPHTDGADLARRARSVEDPHPGIALGAARMRQAEIGEDVDHELLHAMHVARRGVGAHGHTEDRVADQLAGAVVRHVATAIGLDQLGPHRRGRHEHMVERGAHAERVDVRVLEEEQVVVRVLEQGVLERVRVAVAHASEPARVQHAQSSCDQSRVSMMSRHLARNADA